MMGKWKDKMFVDDEGRCVVCINPGTGPIEGAEAAHAAACIAQLLVDAFDDTSPVSVERMQERDDGKGRFGFTLARNGRRCEVDMPGLPLNEVRMEPGDSPWDFPRLYVDG